MSRESSAFARVARSARIKRRSEADRSVSAFSKVARRAAYRLLATFKVQVSIPESLRRLAALQWMETKRSARASLAMRVRSSSVR